MAISRKKKWKTIRKILSWSPPPLGLYKLNFDATYAKGIAHPAVLIRDENEVVIKA